MAYFLNLDLLLGEILNYCRKLSRSVSVFLCNAGSCSAGSAVTCDECLQLSPHCAWCTQEVSSQGCLYETHIMQADDHNALKNI